MPHKAPDLRDRYLEWCSARVVERLTGLSPAELDALEKRAEGSMAADESGPALDGGLGRLVSGLSGHLGSIARREIELLYLDLQLPDFDRWAAAYRHDPTAVDRELIGLKSRRKSAVEDPA